VEDGLFLPDPVRDEDLDDDDEQAKREQQVEHILADSSSKSNSHLTKRWEDVGLRSPFISCSSVGRKVVIFDVSTNLCPGVTQHFSITFTPGIPARICLLDVPPAEAGPQVTVRNGEHLPPLTVACFDFFNNRTDPDEVSFIYFPRLVMVFVFNHHSDHFCLYVCTL